MKQLAIGFVAGGILIGGLSSLLKTNPSTSADPTNGLTENEGSRFFPPSSSTKAGSAQRPPSASSSPRRSTKDSSSQAVRSISDFLTSNQLKSKREINQMTTAIYNLDRAGVEALLDLPEMANVTYFTRGMSTALSAAISRLAELDPEAALQKALTFSGNSQSYAMNAVFSEWPKSDPEAALLAATNVENAAQRKSALTAAIGGLAYTNPTKALALAKEHSLPNANSQILAIWAKKDPEAALKKADEVGLDDWARRTVMQQWLAKDPEAALSYAKNIDNEFKRSQTLSSLISIKIQSDEKAGLALLQEYGEALDDDHLSSIVRNFAHKDPAAALAWIEQRPNSSNKKDLYRNLMSQWFQNDEKSAIAYYENIEDPALKKQIGESYLQSLTHRNPDKFMENYQKFSSNSSNNQWMLRNTMERLAKTNPKKAQEYLTLIDNPKDRQEALKGIVNSLAEVDFDAALVLIDQLTDPREKSAALGSAYKKHAEKNPAEVAELFLKDGGVTKLGDYGISSLLYTFARTDLKGAQEFLQKIEDPMAKDLGMRSMLNTWAGSDPKGALEFALTQEPTQGIKLSMWSIGRELAKEDPQEAIATIAGGELNFINDNLLKAVFYEWGDNDLEAASAGLATLDYDDYINEYIYNDYGKRHSADPEAGVAWLASIEDENAQSFATDTFTSKWAFNDPTAASEWVKTLPDGSQRDAAIKSIAYAFDNAEPAYALDWTASITDPVKRTNAMRAVYVNWQRLDRTKAQQWLNNNQTLPEEQRTEWSNVR